MIYGNGSPITDAFYKDTDGVWRRPSAVWGKTPQGEWVKAWPQDLAPDPLTGVVVSPDSQNWVFSSGLYRATMSAAPIGGSGNYSYVWSATNGGVIASGQGTANVTVTNTVNDKRSVVTCTMTDLTLGGSASDTATAGTNAPTLFATVSPSSRTWSGSAGAFSTTFSVTATGGLGTYNYNWSATGGATIASGQGTTSVTVSGSSNGAASTVTCTVTSGSQTVSSNGSVAAASIAALALSLTPTSQNWSGNAGAYSASVQANPSGGSGSYGYAWSATGATITSGQGTANITLSSVGGQSASISCTITDTVLGGTKSATSSIAAKALTASLSPTTVSGAATTVGVQTSTTSVTVGGGSGNYSYEWRLTNGNGPNIISSRQGTSVGQFEAAPAAGSTVTATWYCRVTDNVTGSIVDTGNVSVSITRNYTSMSVSVSPTSLSGSSTSEPVSTSGSATANVSGGSGSYSYEWLHSVFGTGGIVPVNAAAKTTAFRTSAGAINAGQTLTSGYICRVTDTVTGEWKQTGDVNITLTCNYAALSATAVPGSLSGSSISEPVTTSGAATCNTSGGSGNFTYLWEWDGGAATGGIVPVTANSISSTFRSADAHAPGTTRGAGFRCRVTDNVTGSVVVTNSVGVNLTRTAPAALTGAITPNPMEWFGSGTKNASGTAQPSGGVSPYTYSWYTDSAITISSGQAAQTCNFRSTQGSAANVYCEVTDSVGTSVTLAATINQFG